MANEQKTPLARSLPQFATQKALDQIAIRGKALPGIVTAVSGTLVTVAFQVQGIALQPVQMPIFGAEYVRLPVQAGDKGVAFPADVYLGGVSGMGQGVADTTLQGNLSTLVWFPIGNKSWLQPPGGDANTLSLYGHLALLLLDSIAGNSSLKLTASGITLAFGTGSIAMTSSGITLTYGSHTIVINSTGVIIEGKTFLLHDHTAVTTGTGVSGPVGP